MTARPKTRHAPARPSASEEPDRPESEWPTARMAAKLAGVSVTTIRNWEESGELRSSKHAGVKRFNPIDLAKLAPSEETLRRDLVVVLAEQAQRLLKLSTEPVQRLFEQFNQTLDRQAARIAELEKRHLAVLAQYEDALSHRHERDLEVEVTRRQQERIDKGVRTLEEWLPKLASQAMGRTKVQKVIESLSDAQLHMLREIDAIDEQQFDLLRRIREDAKAKREDKSKPESEKGKPNESTEEASGDDTVAPPAESAGDGKPAKAAGGLGTRGGGTTPPSKRA